MATNFGEASVLIKSTPARREEFNVADALRDRICGEEGEFQMKVGQSVRYAIDDWSRGT